MNIIIAGGGKVGATLARQLTAEGHDITLIDENSRVLNACVNELDIMAVQGNCAAMNVLLQAGIRGADLLIAVTNLDEVNLLCCTTAHGLNTGLHTIARIRNPEYTEQIYALRALFPLSMTINPELQTAREIARLLKSPGFLRRDTFARSRMEIVELRIEEDSKLRDVSLMQMADLIKTRVLVCTVLRDGTAMAPRGDFVLKEGDRIFVTAPTRNLTTMLRSLGIITRRARKVVLCGGGRISYYLAEILEKDGISVYMVDKDRSRCRELAEFLPRTEILCADATDQNRLDHEDLYDCDALVSLTGVDELNMIISLYADSREIPQVITKLSHIENRSVINALSLGSVVCPKDQCCSGIVRYVRAMNNQTGAALSLHTIADGQAEAVEFVVDETAKNCGVPLKQLKLKPNVLIAGITRGKGTEIPGGDSVFQQGDSVVVVTGGRGVLQQFNDIFA